MSSNSRSKNAKDAKAAEKEAKVQSAVSWKIFEVQALLVGGRSEKERVTEKMLDLGHKWLQPSHYEEVVKERAIDGRCGYPLCSESVTEYASKDHPVYRINLKDKSIDNMASGRFYCHARGGECMQKSEEYAAGFDESHPIGRQIATTLDTSKVPEGIEDVLGIIKFHDSSDEEEAKEHGHRQAAAKAKGGNRNSPKRSAPGYKETPDIATNTNGIVARDDLSLNSTATAEERAPPPGYTDKRLLQGGAVQPKYWAVKNTKDIVLDKQTGIGSKSMSGLQSAMKSSVGNAQSDANESLPNPNVLTTTAARGTGMGIGIGGIEALIRSPSSVRATEILERLRSDPTKRGGGVPTPQLQAGSPTGRGGPGIGKSPVPSPASVSVSRAAATEMNMGGAPEVMAPIAPGLATVAPGHAYISPRLDPSKIKEVKPTPREAHMRKAFKAGGSSSMSMSMMAPGPPVPNKGKDKDKKCDNDDVDEEEEEEEEESDALKALNATDFAAEEAEYQARLDAGHGYSSWRDNGDRLDTTTTATGSNVTAILSAAPPNVGTTAATTVQRVRMNPRGARAKELRTSPLSKQVQFADAIDQQQFNTHPPQSQPQFPTVAPSKENAVLDENASEEEQRFMEGVNEEGANPVAHYDNKVITGKVREVGWTEPDPDYLKSRLKSVSKRVPPKVIDTMARKNSLFKEQRQRQREKSQIPGIKDANLSLSVGAKTVNWEIKETSEPSVMPESSIITKHGDDYEYKGKGRDNLFNRERGIVYHDRHTDKISGYEDDNDNEYQDGINGERAYNTHDDDFGDAEDPDDRREREEMLAKEEKDMLERETQLQNNRQLRQAFFSSTGVSAIIIPEGFSTGEKSKISTNTTLPGASISSKDDLNLEDIISEEEQEEEEKEEEDIFSDSDTDTEIEKILPPRKPSTFLVLYTAIDDLFSYVGAIIKRRPATSSTSGDAKEAKGSVDIEYERNNTIMLANTDRIVSAAGSKQSILSHVSRGVATSELSLKINNVLLPTQLAEYHYIKKRVIGMLDATHECPALTSTGWALLGLLLIDGIVRRRRLLENHISGSDKTVQSESQIAALEQQWEVKIRKQVPFRAEGTRQQEGVVSIDEHELRLLRAFFDEL